jgi:predicted AlkP superfamily pyrophosphatase or phosphodiesterase
MDRMIRVVCLSAAAAVAGAPAAARAASVLLVSIDGMSPSQVLGAAAGELPNLQSLIKEGVHASGAASVMPTVTFPAHTTIITGVHPASHGIGNNKVFDPRGDLFGAWHWYYQDIEAPTLFTWARAAGLKTAAVTWPVTAGAPVDFLLPDMYPVANVREAKNLVGLSRGLDDDVLALLADVNHVVKMKDAVRVAIAERLLRKRPDLMAVHFLDLDTARHRFGPDSEEARSALQTIDGYLGRMFDVLRAEGRWDQTAVVVVSDHGFAKAKVEREVRVGTLLRALGLVQVDGAGRVAGGRAFVWTASGTAAIVLAPEATDEDRRRIDGAVKLLLDNPTLGVQRAFRGKELAATRGFRAPPGYAVHVVLEARPGFAIGARHDAPELLAPGGDPGIHGYAPDVADLRASFLMRGPGVQRGKKLGLVHLADVAPTIARILGLRTGKLEGRPLTEAFEPAAGARAARP